MAGQTRPVIETLFATKIYRVELDRDGTLNAELAAACRSIARDDRAGRAWSRKNFYPGYTSYASLDDLTRRAPAFATLSKALNRHVAAFARELGFALGRPSLKLDSMWINLLDRGGVHGAHLHPNSVVSGTYYVVVPKGASALRFEDPRLALMMAAPPRKTPAGENAAFASMMPRPGTLLLWESWLRHEVPMNHARTKRISVSFNYAWR